jgi:hypothetical protein
MKIEKVTLLANHTPAQQTDMDMVEQDIRMTGTEGDAGQLTKAVDYQKHTRRQKHNYNKRQKQILKRQTAAKSKQNEQQPVQQPK